MKATLKYIAFITLLIVNVYNAVPIQSLNVMKDVTYNMNFNEDKESCSIQFKPRFIPNSNQQSIISELDSNDYSKAFTIQCKSKLKEKEEYQKQQCTLKTTISSSIHEHVTTYSTLPKYIVNDTNLQYGYLKLNLDPKTLSVLSSNYQLLSQSKSNNEQLYVKIEFYEESYKPFMDTEKKPGTAAGMGLEEEEKKEESQSFLGKYWLYLVPLFLIVIINLIGPEPPQQQQQQQQQRK
ncbi:ubiquitin [Tieghemostelium lacteum]|uniref:Ubiquitin n=1 Tax=Tieghemostelium lacteum TaxID=361077 RepID=A0A151ZE07_TIELA|nr:ubiquitin [Tieghemostelium lacteum]|eukprot:KYQ92124.1 ubiquitin [Tieghemostelium lacteum]